MTAPDGKGFRIREGNGVFWYEWAYFRDGWPNGSAICINTKGDRYEGNMK